MKNYSVQYACPNGEIDFIGIFSTEENAKLAVKKSAEKWNEKLDESTTLSDGQTIFYVKGAGKYYVNESEVDEYIADELEDEDEEEEGVVTEQDAKRIIDVAKFAAYWMEMVGNNKPDLSPIEEAMLTAKSCKIACDYAEFRGLKMVKLEKGE
jgi:hypothetical protein